MSNHWIEISRVLLPIEGLAGMASNFVLIFYLARTTIGQAARLYYYSCIVTAVLSFYTSLGIAITVDLPTMGDGNVLGIFYGPLLFSLPKWANDIVAISFFAQIHTMWQMIPAPSILQLLSLSRVERSNFTKLLIAYALPITFNAISWIQMPALLPSDDFREELSMSVQRLYGTNSSEFHVYGIPVQDRNRFDVIDLAIFDVAPSFVVSYALFGFSAYKIRGKLIALGASISRKTKQMQFRFFLTQIAQVLLPLILMTIPLCLLFGAAFMGKELHNLPFLIAGMLWPMPTLTALLLLAFVQKTVMSTRTAYSKQSLSMSKSVSVHYGKSSTNVAQMQNF